MIHLRISQKCRIGRSSMEKSRINVVVIGHADVGKSTLVGHLAYKCGEIDGQTIEDFEKIAHKADSGFDQLAAEWITVNTSLRRFDSLEHKFNVIDTPGHSNFKEDMISGISQADVALLVIDSSKEQYEVGIGHDGQTREHCLLAYTLGVKQMIVAINKMDENSVTFSEERWKEIRSEIAAYLKKIGYKPMKIPFIPTSSRLGDCLNSKSIHMPWYNGPTLLEALNNITTPKRPIDKPLRVPILDVRKNEGIEAVLIGRVETGVLQAGMEVNIAPCGIIGVVESLQINFHAVSRANPGDIVSININHKWNIVKIIRSGHVLSNQNDHPARGVASFDAQVIIVDCPRKICNGYSPIIDCHTSHTLCRFSNIKEKLDQRTGRILLQNPPTVEKGDACIVRIELESPVCVEQFKDFPRLGRFAVRDSGRTVAVGVVKTTFHE